MCIINEPAEVTKTKIFVAPNSERTRQVTVYSNQVMTESPNNVMVLPIPYPESLKFIDLSDYKNMFDDLEKNFKTISLSNSLTNCLSNDNDFLPTFDVGSYRITVAANHQRLDSVNPNEFGKIQNHIKRILEKYYQKCGFIVCKLIPGRELEYHPFGYSHRISHGMLFVPTRHQHNHSTPGMSPTTGFQFSQYTPINANSINSPSYPMQGEEETESDWDHDIYSFNTDSLAGNCRVTNSKICLKLDKFENFDFGEIRSLNKYHISGSYPNNDVYFAMVK